MVLVVLATESENIRKKYLNLALYRFELGFNSEEGICLKLNLKLSFVLFVSLDDRLGKSSI